VRTAAHYLMFDLVQGPTKLVDWRYDLLERDDLSAVHPEEHARLRRPVLRKLAWIKARECGLRYPACPRPR
jgi:hypothetical protein